MGVGSQRIALEKSEYASIFRVKPFAPKVFLIGNIGMAQLLNSDALDQCQRAVDMIEADALAIHFNLVQEFIQVEGDRRFKGLLNQLEHICQKLSVPVVAKEVGCGMDARSAQRLRELGISAIDIGGRGGTSWALIEGLRSPSPLVQGLGDTFRNWGIPTAYSLHHVHRAMPEFPVIATGGIRDGYMVAKAVALGARFAGIGLPLLRAALESEDGPVEVLQTYRKGLELAMLASGCQRLADLSSRIQLGRPLEEEFLQSLTQTGEGFRPVGRDLGNAKPAYRQNLNSGIL
jgi:isopentenyl-diphosphate delta-isomerase